jgi:hypothetical protein
VTAPLLAAASSACDAACAADPTTWVIAATVLSGVQIAGNGASS